MKKRIQLIGLLEKPLSNLWLRVVVAFIIAYSVLVGLSVLEQKIPETLLEQKTTEKENVCSPEDSDWLCLAKQLLLVCKVQLLLVCKVENIEGFALLLGASLYMLEGLERRQRIIYEAWQIVDNAAGAKVSTSHARVKALEVLNNYGVAMRRLNAPNADLTDIELANAKLYDAKLTKAELTGAELTGADLTKANLAGANLNTAKLAKALLIRANLSETDLSIADLRHADLRLSNLSRAQLIGANLTGANLTSANLTGSDFRYAKLNGANLKHADFTGADLTDANLNSADLTGADLTSANLEGISWNQHTKWKNARGLDKAENVPDALRQKLGLA
ncbi:MAG: pentapeptide repeat-containing protein [Moorea sp. SIO2I5]|nr:pentapeptide repeat-containing protein [Moorena sp. SIO2I5]